MRWRLFGCICGIGLLTGCSSTGGTTSSITGGSTSAGVTSTNGGSGTGSGSGATTSGEACHPDCTGKTCGPDGCDGGCGDCAANKYCDPSGTCHASNIEHVILIVQENHTFETYFGKYCQAVAGSNPSCTSGPMCCEGAPLTDGQYTDPTGAVAEVLDDDPNNPAANFATDRDHLQVCELQQINGGLMNQYVTGATGASTCYGVGPDCSTPVNWVLADGATSSDPVEYYWTLAAQSALADRYFQPLVGSSSSNDMYFAAAHFQFVDNTALPDVVVGRSPSSGNSCDDPLGCLAAPAVTYAAPTIADVLFDAGLTFGIYADGFAEAYAAATNAECADPSETTECPYSDCAEHPEACYGCLYDPTDYPFLYFQTFADLVSDGGTALPGGLSPTPYEKDFNALQTDLDDGGLPTFSFVKARIYHNEHPNFSTIADGVSFVSAALGMIESSPYAANTLVLLTWDEGGGFFDHISPPAPPPTSVDTDRDGGAVPYGTRVPMIALGPFAKAGTVSHVTMEHSSIVKFVEFNFLGKTGQLGARDGWVNDLGSLLDPVAVGLTVP
jgi:phospholipase C